MSSTPGGDTVTLSRAEYDALIDRLDELDAMARAREIEARDDLEFLPVEAVERLVAGEHPLKVWRRHRGLTQQALAVKADVPQGYISEIESGRKPGSIETLKALAAALGVKIDDIVR